MCIYSSSNCKFLPPYSFYIHQKSYHILIFLSPQKRTPLNTALKTTLVWVIVNLPTCIKVPSLLSCRSLYPFLPILQYVKTHAVYPSRVLRPCPGWLTRESYRYSIPVQESVAMLVLSLSSCQYLFQCGIFRKRTAVEHIKIVNTNIRQ
jgi:hypothetical protein